VPSHGAQLLGAFYLASGSRPHPAAIIYHGFPGYEQNLDLAQTLRRAGYNVLAVHYRGSWGVSGNFSYQHAIEDADAEVEWITSADVAAKYRVDPTRIVLIGHSMGGYMALSAAHHAGVAAAIAISGASLGRCFAGLKPEDKDKAVAQSASRTDPVDLLPLAGTSANALGSEVFDHRDEWETDHPFSDHRIALENTILTWLKQSNR
jgi:dienelactone hydrolase